MRVQPASRKIAILLSGRGSNFCAIADRVAAGGLDAEIALVLSSSNGAPGLDEARKRGFDAVSVPAAGMDRLHYDSAVVKELKARQVALVCLAGFMRILSPALIEAFPNAILNIHPSLLPSFPGLDAQQQALDHGVRFSGCTVHFVDESLDGGPIISQAAVPVMADDSAQSLSDRILTEEHRIYSEAIDAVLAGRCQVDGRRVVIHEEGI